MRVVALVSIVCGCLLIFGGAFRERIDPLGVRVLSTKTLVTVVITLKHVTDDHRWLSVHGCSAHVTEHGTFCTGDWEVESTRELEGRKQELFDWRRVPGGTIRITAMAFDGNQKVLASGTAMVIR